MNTNIPALATVYADLESVLAKLAAIDADTIESANLVPMVKAVQAIGAYQAAIDAQIQTRAIGNGELIPGVVVKDSVVHRRWSDPEVAAHLAQETLGDKAFSRALLSPAQMETIAIVVLWVCGSASGICRILKTYGVGILTIAFKKFLLASLGQLF